MSKEVLEYNLLLIVEQLSTEQLIFARRNRNWREFDKLDQIEKLRFRMEELEYYAEDIDPNYKPKGYLR